MSFPVRMSLLNPCISREENARDSSNPTRAPDRLLACHGAEPDLVVAAAQHISSAGPSIPLAAAHWDRNPNGDFAGPDFGHGAGEQQRYRIVADRSAGIGLCANRRAGRVRSDA